MQGKSQAESQLEFAKDPFSAPGVVGSTSVELLNVRTSGRSWIHKILEKCPRTHLKSHMAWPRTFGPLLTHRLASEVLFATLKNMDVFVRAYMDVFTAFAEKNLRREAVRATNRF